MTHQHKTPLFAVLVLSGLGGCTALESFQAHQEKKAPCRFEASFTADARAESPCEPDFELNQHLRPQEEA